MLKRHNVIVPQGNSLSLTYAHTHTVSKIFTLTQTLYWKPTMRYVYLKNGLFIYLFICREGESCNHVMAFLYQIHHWSSTRTKEIPAEKSCKSGPQKWHKPRGDKITPQPLMKLIFAKATTDQQQKKRDPVMCHLYNARAKKSRSMTSNEALDSMGQALKS